MTREEAIICLQGLLDNPLINKGSYLAQAIEMAIQALSQEPKFIAKADGTIEQIKNCEDCLFKREWQKIGKLISVVLEKQTEQESKTGHWIVDEYGIKHCPFCNAINNSVYDSYCPNCGARMESEE